MKPRVVLQLPPTALSQRQDSTWNPAQLVAWLVVENDRLRVVIRGLELELEKRQSAPFLLYKEYEHE